MAHPQSTCGAIASQSVSPQSPSASRAAVQAALVILGNAGAGRVPWQVAGTHARKLLNAALLALHEEAMSLRVLPAHVSQAIDEYNALTEEERRHWHEVAGSAVPAEAWAAWKAARNSL